MPGASPVSVRRRLLLYLLVGFALCWLGVAALTYRLSMGQVNRLFDEDMVDFGQAALRLMDLASHRQEGPEQLEPGLVERSRQEIDRLPALHRQRLFGYILWHQGQPLFGSSELPAAVLEQPEGFSNLRIARHSWRVLRLSANGFRIWVGEKQLSRRHPLHLQLFYSLFPLLLALPLLGGLSWLAVARGMAPLRRVQTEVQRRSAGHLQPIAVHQVPLEIRGLVDELNLLLERLRSALEAERRLTSDAAHEIRTPLASLRTHAQVALRSQDPAAYARGLLQVSRSVERISTLMEQILLLARLDGDTLLERFVPLNLAHLAQDVLSELAPQAIDKDIELSLQQRGASIAGIELPLKVMLSNLVGNALRYTPTGGRVEVVVEEHARQALLWVRDNGPGVSAPEREVIFTRFYRSPPNGAGEGSGLGLSIVKRVVELHGGSIRLGTGLNGKGLGVRVVLPKRPNGT